MQNTHHDSSAESAGISLVGKYAGSSPTNDPLHPTVQLCNNSAELSAEEIDQRISEHLESKILQWSANTLMQEFMFVRSVEIHVWMPYANHTTG